MFLQYGEIWQELDVLCCREWLLLDKFQVLRLFLSLLAVEGIITTSDHPLHLLRKKFRKHLLFDVIVVICGCACVLAHSCVVCNVFMLMCVWSLVC